MTDVSVPPTEKTCSTCGETKRRDSFKPRKDGKDGYTNQCRACINAQSKIRHEANPTIRRTSAKRRYDAHRDTINIDKRERRKANPMPGRQYAKIYYSTHKKQARDYHLAWKNSHRDRMRMHYRKAYAKKMKRPRLLAFLFIVFNIEHIIEQIDMYKLRNLDKRRAYEAKRRATKKSTVIHELTAQDWQDILAASDHRCAYCGCKPQRLTQDHITPLSKGGHHTKRNIVPACHSCNSRKRTGPPLKPVQPLLL